MLASWASGAALRTISRTRTISAKTKPTRRTSTMGSTLPQSFRTRRSRSSRRSHSRADRRRDRQQMRRHSSFTWRTKRRTHRCRRQKTGWLDSTTQRTVRWAAALSGGSSLRWLAPWTRASATLPLRWRPPQVTQALSHSLSSLSELSLSFLSEPSLCVNRCLRQHGHLLLR